MKDKPFQSETPEEYSQEEQKYFRNIQDKKREGLSAADRLLADRHLPTPEQEHRNLERWEQGLNKASRSGAFSQPNVGPAIFPSGLKNAMDFIDENTPGRLQLPEPRPVLKEQTRAVNTPKAEVTITDVCMDCLKPVDQSKAGEIVMGMQIAMSDDAALLTSMGLNFGSIVLFVIHRACDEKAKVAGQNATPLVLVRYGELVDSREVERALKYGQAFQLHTGQEATLGQWEMVKRQQRMEQQLNDYLLHADKSSEIYRRNRVEKETTSE